MNFDTGSLISSLIISCAGWGFFMYGKKAGRMWPLVGGLVLMVFPYFIGSVPLMWGIAVVIVVGVYLLREQ